MGIAPVRQMSAGAIRALDKAALNITDLRRNPPRRDTLSGCSKNIPDILFFLTSVQFLLKLRFGKVFRLKQKDPLFIIKYQSVCRIPTSAALRRHS